MKNKNIHFSSRSDLWETPQWLFDKLNKEHNFNLDVCATKENTKCQNYFTEENNALMQNWTGNCFMNPPYSKLKVWIEKAYNEVKNKHCNKVVCLIPARTDTIAFHEFCLKGKIEFLKGRLKFSNSKNPAPFPSMIVIFENL